MRPLVLPFILAFCIQGVAAQTTAPAAKAQQDHMMQIAKTILHQVQPCANHIVNPAPGAERIAVTLHLHYNRDGTLAAPPEILDHSGIDDANAAYVARIDEQVTAVFRNCPLRDMPSGLYEAPGGWSDFRLRFRLPG